MTPNEHLTPSRTTRGFSFLPPIPSLYDGEVQVSESSLATQPALWLQSWQLSDGHDPSSKRETVAIHLTAADALRLADQLRWMVEHHYQQEGRQ